MFPYPDVLYQEKWYGKIIHSTLLLQHAKPLQTRFAIAITRNLLPWLFKCTMIISK